MQDSTDLQAAVDEKGQNEPYIIIYVWELLMAILCVILMNTISLLCWWVLTLYLTLILLQKGCH